MIASIQEETVKFCYNVTVETQTERRRIIGGGMLTEGFEDDANYMMVSGDDYEGYDEIPEYEEKPEPVRRDAPKVGRNDLCPCGSGKKYKHCCGKNQ